MELKEGYKQTEVGLVPSDWDLISFGKAFDFLSTASYSRSQISENGDTEYIHYGDIHTRWNHFLDFEENILPKISKDQLKNHHLIKEGDLIMADASEDYEGIGKSVEIKNIGNRRAISGLHTFLLRDSKGYFVNGFKAYIHSNRLVKNQFDKLATGLKVYGVSKNNLKLIQIPLPPTKEEQTRIATTLSDADALIISLEKLIAKKRNIKQGAMQELLTGKKRLPGFRGKWEVKTLGEILSYEQPTKYLVKSTEYYDNNDIAVLTANKSFILGYTDENDGVFENVPVVIFDDFTTASKYVDFPFKVKSSALKILKLKNESSDLRFVFGKMQLIQFPLGDHKRYWISEYQHLKIEVPSIAEQTAIAKTLSDMDAEIEQLEQKLDKFKMIKQGMMQELLTGKTRLV